MQIDSRPANQLDRDLPLAGGRGDPLGLGDDVGDGDLGIGGQLSAPGRPR